VDHRGDDGGRKTATMSLAPHFEKSDQVVLATYQQLLKAARTLGCRESPDDCFGLTPVIVWTFAS